MTTKVHKTVQGIQEKLRNIPTRTYTVAGILLFAAIGTMLIVGSKAATPTAKFEAEAGTRSGNASVIADNGASGGSAVKFSSTSGTTGSCPYRFPTPSCVGLPAGWTSTATYTSDRIISADNAIVENITMDGAVLYCT